MSPEPKGLSRRDFLKTAAAGTASLLGGTQALGTLPALAATDKMPTRPFGKTGVHVSTLSVGTMWDTVNTQIVLRQALSLGATYWDTAESYHGGYSEVGIGNFFARFPQARKQVFLVTKTYSPRPSPAVWSAHLEQSLKKLQTDYIDLYFIHAISSSKTMDGTVKAWAEKAKSSGKIKFIGFSTHANMEECLLGASKLGWVDGIMMTYNYRIMHTDEMRRAVEACHKAGIGLTAMKTQGGGPVGTGSEAELKLAGRFVRQGYTPEQAKLKAVWESPYIASICSQMPNVAILRANAAAAMDKTKLSAGDRAVLKEYAAATCDQYCAGCTSLCEGALKGRVPVGDVMRSLMYYRSYQEPALAAQTFNAIPAAARRQLAALDYGPAESACPHSLPIGRLMQEAATLLA
jgi:predicted aldo/keto reductase-like oxidoreductase